MSSVSPAPPAGAKAPEDPELERLRAALRARWQPADALEEAAIDALAAAYRRRQELDALEARVLSALRAGKGGEGLPALSVLCRYAARLAKDTEAAEERLRRLRAERLARGRTSAAAPASSVPLDAAQPRRTAERAPRSADAPVARGSAAASASLESVLEGVLADLLRPPRGRGGLVGSTSGLALAASGAVG